MWLKLKKYTDSELVTQCVDKYRVREYVIAMGFEDILTPLIGVWNSVEEIAFDMLPDKFVIKCNHVGTILFVQIKIHWIRNKSKKH